MCIWGNSWAQVKFRGQCPQVSVSSSLSLMERASLNVELTHACGKAVQWAPGVFSSQPPGGWDLRCGAPHQALEWVLGMWSQVLKHVWQAFDQLYHLPSIRIFKDNEWRLFLPCFHTQQQTEEKGTQISEYLTHSAPWMLSKSFKHIFVTNDMSYST